MTTYYFSNSGSNAANGTSPATPKKNPNLVTFASGDVILLQGSVFSSVAGGSVFALSTLTDITIDQWASNGCQPARVRADVPATAAWTADAVSTSVYSSLVGAGLALHSNTTGTSVMVGAGRRIDSFGRHSPFLSDIFVGTVTTTSASAVVNGTGTRFTATFAAGVSTITVNGTTKSVLSIQSDTQLTCTAIFGANNTAQTYTYSALLATTLAGMTSGTFYYDSTSGLLYVHLGGVSPSTTEGYNQVSYTLALVDVATFDTMTGLRIGNISFEWGNDGDAQGASGTGNGYQCLVKNSTDTRIRNCRSIGFGYHGFGFTTGTGTAQTDNQLDYCDAHGIGQAGTNFVFYANGANVSTCRGEGCRAYVYGRIYIDGTPVSTSQGCVGFYSHTSGSTPDTGPFVNDVEWRRCVSYGYPDLGNAIQAFDTADVGFITNTDDSSKYPVRCTECRIFGGAQTRCTDSMAYIRCILSYSNSSASKATYANGGNGAFRLSRSANLGSYYVMLDSCAVECRMDQDPGVTGESFMTFSVNPGSGAADQYGKTTYEGRLKLKNSTIMENGSALASNIRALFKQQNSASANTYIDSTDTIIGFATAQGDASGQFYRLVTNDTNTPNANLNFRSNAYFNIGSGTTRWSAAAARDTQAEWASVIDATLVIPAAYPNKGGMAFLDPQLTTNFAAIVSNVSGHSNFGINLAVYSSNYGAYQYGAAAVLADPANIGSGSRRGGRIVRV